MRDFAQYHGGLGLASMSDVSLYHIAKTVQFSLRKQGYATELNLDPIARQATLISAVCRVRVSIVLNVLLKSDESSFAPSGQPGGSDVDVLEIVEDLEAATDVGCRLEIKLSDCVAFDAESLLAFLLIDLVRVHDPDSVEWLEPEMKISSNEFLECFDMQPSSEVVLPRRAVRHSPARRFASVRAAAKTSKIAESTADCDCVPLTNGLAWSDAQVALAEAYRIPTVEDQQAITAAEPSAVLRLATWAISGVVAFLVLPVALALFIINLFSGEDFRLNAQVLAVTALLAVLHTTGAFASIAALLPQ